ncbi:MAG: hypothetical protein WC382_05320 [Methanoregulaceae archaeon]
MYLLRESVTLRVRDLSGNGSHESSCLRCEFMTVREELRVYQPDPGSCLHPPLVPTCRRKENLTIARMYQCDADTRGLVQSTSTPALISSTVSARCE